MAQQLFFQHPVRAVRAQRSNTNAIVLSTEPFFKQALELGQTFKKEVDLQKLETMDLKILDELKKTVDSLSHYSSRIVLNPTFPDGIPPKNLFR